MKRNLQILSLLLLMIVGGASFSWADGITPDLEMSFRTNNDNNGWNGNPKSPSIDNQTFECNHNSGFFVLQKYTIENLAAVKSLTLRLVNGSGADALSIWAFNTNDWSELNASEIASAYETIVGVALHNSGTANQTFLKNEANNKTNGNNFIISGNALTRLKEAASNNTFTLLITNNIGTIEANSNTKRQLCNSGHEIMDNRPTLTPTYYAATLTDGATVKGYDSFAAALSASSTAESNEITITVLENQNISSRVNAITGKTLNVFAGKDGVILTNTASNTLSFLANANNAGTINIGNDEHNLIIKHSNTTTNSVIETSGNSTSAIINIENVTFKDINSSNTGGLIKANDSNAKVKLRNVVFDGCSVTAENAGVVYCNANGNVTLSGNISFINCTGNCFKAKGRLVENNFTPSEVMTIYSDGIALGQSAVIGMKAENRNKYVLVNEDRCVVGKGNSSNEELVVSEAYTLRVFDANAATLIIPFSTTIPEGVETYTLNYNGGENVIATPVMKTLAANTPVLVNAAGSTEGTVYKFNANSRATSPTPASTSIDEMSRKSGALTGVYETTTVPSGSYVLYASDEHPIGFYKAGSGVTVEANRAYLTADGGTGARLALVYGEEANGLTEITNIKSSDSQYFDLQGRRVAQPTKGLYIVNGKKVFIK